MTTHDNHEQLENQIREILEEAGWAPETEPDFGRIEVIAYRAGLETARTSLPPACSGSASTRGPGEGMERSFD